MNAARYAVVRGGGLTRPANSDLYWTVIRPDETSDQAFSRLERSRGVLWKWDQISQFCITENAPAGSDMDPARTP